MAQLNSSNMIRIATIKAFDSERYPTVTNIDGTTMKVFNAPILIALQQGFGVPFNIVMPEDNEFGMKKQDGNWSGMIGMLVRGEADLTVGGITSNTERLEVADFSFPMYISDVTFMTNKPEPYPKNFSLFDSFSIGVWISIGISLILISLIFYSFLKRKKTYSDVLLAAIGSLLEQSFSINVRQRNAVFILLTWFLGTAVLISSYKAVILSVLTFPRLVGIRDTKDLAKAAREISVECIGYKDSFSRFKWSELNDEKLEAIGECLKRSNAKSLFGRREFFNYPGRKAFIADRIDLAVYDLEYFVSADSLNLNYFGIFYRKDFCCPRKLESVIQRIIQADLYQKTIRNRQFTLKLQRHHQGEDNYILPLTLTDFSGAFFILFMGYLLSFLVFIAEIITKKVH